MKRLVIETDGTVSRLYVDGIEVKGITKLKFEHVAGSSPELELGFDLLLLSGDASNLSNEISEILKREKEGGNNE